MKHFYVLKKKLNCLLCDNNATSEVRRNLKKSHSKIPVRQNETGATEGAGEEESTVLVCKSLV